ncbi:MAG TPA: acyl-CoA dehydrogenase [Gammaproteobacteria bacterium]|nr:acyl-CoA dehydrogenase [Gammaproteobacteria bacterium]
MSSLVVLVIYLAGAVLLAATDASLKAALIACGALLLFALFSGASLWVALLFPGLTFAALLFVSRRDLRRSLCSAPLLKWYRKVLPPISPTEQEGIDAGTVWWEADLFSGRPDWDKLLSAGRPELTSRELAFIDGPLAELCRMTDNWKINHELADLPAEVRDFIHAQGFLGMIIPRSYGGMEFSEIAQTEIITRLFAASGVVANYIVVPNSLGPAELLLKYGTDDQRNYYLPRLARGAEIPCFALTSPVAGSDATSLADTGIVCKREWQGREILGMRLTFDKRYITQAPVATLIGLAFKLHDPDHLLGDTEDLGITCALLPAATPGIETGQRHYPIGDPFLNGPVRGRDVFVPLDYIIGGGAMAGKGWRMLVDCLSAGRSISLPSISNCIAKRSLAGSSAYARLRRQFGNPLANFEGIQQPLARIAGLGYIINAARLHTAQAIAGGSKPSVPSSILKYHCTELARQIGLDAMDIHGGKAIMKGPRNYLASAYESTPVAITVEGANIMTRSLMIFGQGAIRCHPYVLREMEIARAPADAETVGRFDDVLFEHIHFALRNAALALLHGLTGSCFAKVPPGSPISNYYRQFSRLSAAFALAADAAMLTLQGGLKRRELLSGRLGDLLSMLYLGSMVMKHYESEGCPAEDLPVLEWACAYMLHRYQEAMHEFLLNFPVRPIAWVLRLLVFPLGRRFEPPSDALARRIAELVTGDTPTRRRLIHGVHLTPDSTNPLGILEETFLQAGAVEVLEGRLKDARKEGRLAKLTGAEQIEAACAAGVLSQAEAEQLTEFRTRVNECIAVDEFPYASFARTGNTG